MHFSSLPALLLLFLFISLIVAAPLNPSYPQSANDQFNLLRHTGKAGPFVPLNGFGISPDPPPSCSVDKVHLAMRHAERYPTKKVYKQLSHTIHKLLVYRNHHSSDLGPFGFIPQYTPLVPSSSDQLLGQETSAGPYAGVATAYRVGTEFRARYGNLLSEFRSKTPAKHPQPPQPIPVFASDSPRVIDSAIHFSLGFFGELSLQSSPIVVIPEDATPGATSLTPDKSCRNFHSNNAYVKSRLSEFRADYLGKMAQRLNSQVPKLSPELVLTKADVFSIFQLCAYELNARGYSPFCGIPTPEEWRSYSAHVAHSEWFQHGPGFRAEEGGARMAGVVASAMLEGLVKVFEEGENGGKQEIGNSQPEATLFEQEKSGKFEMLSKLKNIFRSADFETAKSELGSREFGSYFRRSDSESMIEPEEEGNLRKKRLQDQTLKSGRAESVDSRNGQLEEDEKSNGGQNYKSYDQSEVNSVHKPGEQTVDTSIEFESKKSTSSPSELPNVFFNFMHDKDILLLVTSLGLFQPFGSLEISESPTSPANSHAVFSDFPSEPNLLHPFKVSEITPMAARIVHERLRCAEGIFIRVVVNEAVYPLPGCSDGPGFSCSLEKYRDRLEALKGNVSFTEFCGLSPEVPHVFDLYEKWNSSGYEIITDSKEGGRHVGENKGKEEQKEQLEETIDDEEQLDILIHGFSLRN